MIKVLQVYPQMNNAGTERVIMSLFENIDKKQIKMDFLVNNEGELDEKIKKLGGNIYKINYRNNKEYYSELLKFFNKRKYDVVHTHIHGKMNIVLKAAKKAGIKTRIAHSHISREGIYQILKIKKIFFILGVLNNANVFLACSKNAAKWLFSFKWKKATVLYNAINIEKFKFSKDVRINKRKSLEISNNKVIINVARLTKQKNYKKFVKIIKQLVKEDNSIMALIVGEGPEKNQIERRIKKYDIEENVKLLGKRKDVNELLMASDLFLFPSVYEGLGISLVEAQCTGMQCVSSSRVPEEASLKIGLVNKISIHKPIRAWKRLVIERIKDDTDRKQIFKKVEESNYNIKNEILKLEKIYAQKS